MVLLSQCGIRVYCMVYKLQHNVGPVVYGRHAMQVMEQPAKHLGKMGVFGASKYGILRFKIQAMTSSFKQWMRGA